MGIIEAILVSQLALSLALGKMAHVVSPLDQPSNYKDSQTRVDRQKQTELLSKSTTLYVGELTVFAV